MNTSKMIERYQKRTVLFHWIHAGAFLALTITGAVRFLSALIGDGGGGVGIQHRIAAMIFIVAPLAYCLSDPNASLRFLVRTFSWNRSDLKWFKAAPSYYFGGPATNMPPPGRINTGQKMWQLVILSTSAVFIITGAIMWFLRQNLQPQVYQWILSIHGIAFVVVVIVFLVHIYMGILHPRMRGSLRSMLDGKITSDYAKHHHPKWYDELTTGNYDGPSD